MKFSKVRKVSNVQSLKEAITDGKLTTCTLNGIVVDELVVLKSIRCARLVFEKVIFRTDVWIENTSNELLEIEFEHCVFENALFLQDLNIRTIQLLDCSIHHGKFFRTTVNDTMRVYGSKVGVLNIVRAHMKLLEIIKNVSGELRIYSPKAELIQVDANKSDFELEVTNRQIEDVDSKIDTLSINFRSDYGGNISISQIEIDDLEFFGRLKACQFSLSDLSIRNIKFEDFINDGQVKFSRFNIIDGGVSIPIRQAV